MSGGYSREQIDRAERARQAMVRYAREGEYYRVGETAAELLLQQEEERQRLEVYQAGVRYALDLERQRQQAAIDREAAQYSGEVLDAAQARIEADPDFDAQQFDDAASRWRRYAQEEAQAREVKRLTSRQIAAMGPEEWVTVFDPEKGAFRPGYAHDPGEGAGGSADGAGDLYGFGAAGLAPTRLR